MNKVFTNINFFTYELINKQKKQKTDSNGQVTATATVEEYADNHHESDVLDHISEKDDVLEDDVDEEEEISESDSEAESSCYEDLEEEEKEEEEHKE